MTIADIEHPKWEAKDGDTVAKVQARDDGMVYMFFPLMDKWMAVTPNIGFRIAWLMLKYSVVALFKHKP